MKILIIALVLIVMASGFVVADSVTYDVYEGWNLIAAPLVPYNSTPSSAFSGITVMNRITRFDAVSGGDVALTIYTEDEFGNILLGDGYWLSQSQDGSVTIDGIADGVPTNGVITDMCISLPGVTDGEGGWHLISNPYNHEVPVGEDGVNIKFTDGITLKTWKEAAESEWVSNNMIGFDGCLGSDLDTSYTVYASMNSLLPFHGYWLATSRSNLCMIISGTAVAE
ncbi:MAG: hypothetical protein ABFD83_14640 [Armatimonadota bacterium]